MSLWKHPTPTPPQHNFFYTHLIPGLMRIFTLLLNALRTFLRSFIKHNISNITAHSARSWICICIVCSFQILYLYLEYTSLGCVCSVIFPLFITKSWCKCLQFLALVSCVFPSILCFVHLYCFRATLIPLVFWDLWACLVFCIFICFLYYRVCLCFVCYNSWQWCQEPSD